MALKLVTISRFIFFAIVLTQAFTLAKYQVQYKDDDYFYGLGALFCVLSLALWIVAIYQDSLLYCLWFVWFLYSVALVIMIGVIFGGIVIKDQLRNDTFFGPNPLKSTLSLTPIQMLLLLTSTTDQAEVLIELYFTATLNLFDGMEMLEVLLQDRNNAINEGMKITVLTTVIVFFLFSFLELFKVQFVESESQPTAIGVENQSETTVTDREKIIIVNDVFQIVLNTLFLILRLVLWFAYDQDAAIFIAKNAISLFTLFLPYFVEWGWISIESQKAL